MSGQSGPFWDRVEGRTPIPPAAATLGFQFIDADTAQAHVLWVVAGVLLVVMVPVVVRVPEHKGSWYGLDACRSWSRSPVLRTGRRG